MYSLNNKADYATLYTENVSLVIKGIFNISYFVDNPNRIIII